MLHNPLLQSEGMTNEVNLYPDPQAGMTKPGITVDQKAAPTPSHRKRLCLEDQHSIPGGLGDHVQPTDHLIEGEDLHLILHAGSLDRDPRAEVDTPVSPRVIPLLEDLHPDITEDLIHQIINVTSVHTHLTPGEDVNLIRSSSSELSSR